MKINIKGKITNERSQKQVNDFISYVKKHEKANTNRKAPTDKKNPE